MEWLQIAGVFIAVISPVIGWLWQQRKLEGIFEARDKRNEERLKLLEEQFQRSEVGVLQLKIIHSQLAIEALEEWRRSSVSPYVPAQIDRIRDRLDAIEREIGTHETGLRGFAHRAGNKLTALEGRISELEARLNHLNSMTTRGPNVRQ